MMMASVFVGSRERATHGVRAAEKRVERGKNRPKMGERGGKSVREEKQMNAACPKQSNACVEQRLLAFYVTNPC